MAKRFTDAQRAEYWKRKYLAEKAKINDLLRMLGHRR